MNRFATKLSGAALVLALLVAAPACETDDSLGGLVPVCIGFTPAENPTPGEVVAVSSDISDCDTAVVELVITGVDDLWGISFELDYPSGIAQVFPFVDVSTSVLGEESKLVFNLQEDPLGHIEVGVARNDQFYDEGVDTQDLDANPVLLRLGFARFATGGSGEMAFTPLETSLSFRLLGQPPTFDEDVPFNGGTLFIQ